MFWITPRAGGMRVNKAGRLVSVGLEVCEDGMEVVGVICQGTHGALVAGLPSWSLRRSGLCEEGCGMSGLGFFL